MSTTQYPGIWSQCLQQLEIEIPKNDFKFWIQTLQTETTASQLLLFAPNKYVLNKISNKHFTRINEIVSLLSKRELSVNIELGTRQRHADNEILFHTSGEKTSVRLKTTTKNKKSILQTPNVQPTIDPLLTFETFIEGDCNRLAKAAAKQIATNIGLSKEKNSGEQYNPFLIYSGSGLGKTHLVKAIANKVLELKPEANVLFLRSERFVQEMVTAIQNNKMEDFKKAYRSVDVLIVDDIQFFAKKQRTQAEFLHTFNSLLEEQKQIIMTCDTFPKKIENVDESLKSRFGWGLSIAIEMPDIETRMAILLSKASQKNIIIPQEVTFFIAEKIRSNIRELEGALNKVIATANFTNQPISIEFAKQSLKDLISMQDRQVSLENIQKVVADFYHIRIADILSKKRTRSIARPRQMAMFLSKELTNHSLPEIGQAFGGKDHTTVLYACRKMNELFLTEEQLQQDYITLKRLLLS